MSLEKTISLIESKISSYCGLNLAKVQKDTLLEYLKKKAENNNLNEYIKNLDVSSQDFQDIINFVTINETYFFREQQQFNFLKNQVFPKFAARKMNIWSAACSTGEEPISLLALALSCGVDATVYATDIDDNALKILQQGKYRPYSFRKDGSEFHKILEPFGKHQDENFIFAEHFISKIKISKYNLIGDTVLPFTEKMDLIFLRNVFIYFSPENRIKISKKISTAMNDSAYLFFSTNEIGSLGAGLKNFNLYKTNFESIYYFIKNADYKSSQKISSERPAEISSENIKEKKVQRIISQIEECKRQRENKKNTDLTLTQKEKAAPPQLNEIWEQLNALINSRKFNDAENLAKQYEGNHETKMLSKFFQGYIKYQNDEKEEAQKFFEAAQLLKPDFWPAFFYNGLVLKDVGKYGNANISFETCYDILNSETSKGQKYSFILDSFDPAYIMNLCKNLQSGEKL